MVIEMVPAFAFAATSVYLFIPALYYLITGSQLEWASSGIFWRLSTFLGAAIFTFSLISWIGLLEEETSRSSSDQGSGLTLGDLASESDLDED